MAESKTKRKTKAEDLHARMFYAIESNDVTSLGQLLEEGMDANTIYTGKDPMGRPLVWSPLHLCCEKGREQCASMLLSYGANADDQDKWCQTPLMYAIKTEWHNLVALLIASGANLNVQERHGRAALHFAVECTDDQ